MMKTKIFLLLAILCMILSACIPPVTPTPGIHPPPTTFPILILPSNTPSPTLVLTPFLSPTSAATPVITSTPLQRVGNVYPIQFPPNSSYVEIVDSLAASASKTYSINAMKGQIVSVSILVGPDNSYTTVPMKIIGADDTYICPDKQNQNYSCMFWRGTLPATQDYFITLTPTMFLSNFTMRVAINSSGASNQSFSYKSMNGAASFTYQDDFAPIRFRDEVIYRIRPEFALAYIDSKLLKDTNLSEAYFLFGSSEDSEIIESCTEPVSYDGLDIVTSEVDINGIPFTRGEDSWVRSGKVYEQTYYRAVNNGSCYEITLFIQSEQTGNERKFDRAALTQKLEAILSSLAIK